MRIWVDLANSPHVPFFAPIVERLIRAGHAVEVTARDHSDTIRLASALFRQIEIVGGRSPSGLAAKGQAIAARAAALVRFAHRRRFDVALSHGSYAQLVAATALRVRAVTLMDYEHQPANHLSFRLAHRVVVPVYFPKWALRRSGATADKTMFYDGFKEDVYLAEAHLDDTSIDALGLSPARVCVVLRPPPTGALYHRHRNDTFGRILVEVAERSDVDVVVLPRSDEQRTAFSRPGFIVPEQAVHGASLLARADLVVGAGGTMSREAALLGVPTYTVFSGRLAAVDAELIQRGLMRDLRFGQSPEIEFKATQARAEASRQRAPEIIATIERAVFDGSS